VPYPQSVTEVQHNEPHEDTGARLNWLRAGVLGANDGVVSTASIVLGRRRRDDVGATDRDRGLAACSPEHCRWAAGEYVSCPASGTRNARCSTRKRASSRKRPNTSSRSCGDLREQGPDAGAWPSRSPSKLTAKDALGAHAEAELKIDPNEPDQARGRRHSRASCPSLSARCSRWRRS